MDGNMHNKMSHPKNCVMMEDGKKMQMKDGKTMAMYQDMIMSNGTNGNDRWHNKN